MEHYDLKELAQNMIVFIKNSWIVKGALAILSTFFIHLFGGWDVMIKAVITLMVLDFSAKLLKISFDCGGFGIAIKNGKIRSKTLREKTMYKAFRVAITLGAGNQIANILFHITEEGAAITIWGIPISLATRAFFVLYVCIGEVVSIIETLIGVDGEDLAPLGDGVKNAKNNITDRLLDVILDKVESRKQ